MTCMRSSTSLAFLMLALMPTGGCARFWTMQTSGDVLRHQTVRGQLVFHSDEPLPKSHRLLDELIEQRSELLSMLDLQPSDEPIYVYLFASPERYKEYIHAHYPELPDRRAFFVERDTRLEVFAHWGDRVAEDLRHEVAHGYLHSVAPRIPLWLDEGLAENFEVPRGYKNLNWPHVAHLAERLNAGWRPNLERLEALTSPREMDQIDYAESWAWIHFMLRTFPERQDILRRHVRDIRDRGTAEPLSSQLRRISGDPNQVLADYIRHLAAARGSALAARR